MADVIVTLKIMPKSPSADLDKISTDSKKLIAEFKGEVGKEEVEPIAFGLKALKLMFVMDESIGSTDELEAKISKVKNVQSAEVSDVRRAIG